jgi:CRISPR-associated protein Csm1
MKIYKNSFLELSSSLDNKNLKPLKNIFDNKKKYGIDVLNVKNLIEQKDKFTIDKLIERFYRDRIKIENDSININNIDYLLKKYLSLLSIDGKNSYYETLKKDVLFVDKNIEEYFLIAGDFFGIQKFIFSDIEAKFASKILRAKSAYIQIFTKIVAHYIVDKLEIDQLHIITTNAGKFEILSPIMNENILQQIQKEIDSFFIEKYFGESGVGISWTKCKKDEFDDVEKYKRLRKKLSDSVESKKFSKFNLQSINPLMKYEEDIDNQNLCKLCNKKKGRERVDSNNRDEKYIACDSCEQFVKIGKYLTTKKYITFTKDLNDAIPILGDYYIRFDVELGREDKPAIGIDDFLIYDIANEERYNGFAKWELSSYVKNNRHGKIDTFSDLAECSCQKCEERKRDGKEGIEAIISLKADVDGMGNFIKDSSVTESFTKFNFFSRIVDYFFSVYVPYIMAKNYPHTYTIFAGGDDLFLIGAWDEVIELAQKVREDFENFIKHREDLSISMGLILTKPNRPINYIADISEHALEEAKDFCCIKKDGKYSEVVDNKEKLCDKNNYEKKDAITLFRETAKWDSYLKIIDELKEFYIIKQELNSSTLYSLLEISNMAIRFKYKQDSFTLRDALWKSKIRYLFNRNIDKEYHYLVELLNRSLKDYPKETKMFLVEFIYKRRKL